MNNVAEILLAQIWNSQWFTQPLVANDGAEVRVIYPGVWTHGFGPDFTNALLDIDGTLCEGDVEIERSARGWRAHGHDRNDAFDNVILLVLASERDEPVHRSNGAAVRSVSLNDRLKGQLEDFTHTPGLRPLGAIGFDHCAPSLAAEAPQEILAVLRRAGDRRMHEKVATISGELALHPPAQVLYQRLLDALGFSRNRAPMAEVAARLPYEHLQTKLHGLHPGDRFWHAAALLLGVAGFLPLSPRDSTTAELTPTQVGRIEQLWGQIGTLWHGLSIAPSFWNLSRIRPAAHPVRRLLALAILLATSGNGLVESVVSLVTEDDNRRRARKWLTSENRYLGNDHAHEVVVNVVIPFAIAYGESANHTATAEAAAQLWADLPAGRGNAVTRKTLEQICGHTNIKLDSARAEQGLLHINRNGCRQMRCYECPIAHLALQWESNSPLRTSRLPNPW